MHFNLEDFNNLAVGAILTLFYVILYYHLFFVYK
jgi:hypothetical protein